MAQNAPARNLSAIARSVAGPEPSQRFLTTSANSRGWYASCFLAPRQDAVWSRIVSRPPSPRSETRRPRGTTDEAEFASHMVFIAFRPARGAGGPEACRGTRSDRETGLRDRTGVS